MRKLPEGNKPDSVTFLSNNKNCNYSWRGKSCLRSGSISILRLRITNCKPNSSLRLLPNRYWALSDLRQSNASLYWAQAMMLEHCRTGTEPSIPKVLFGLYMMFTGNQYFSGKLEHTYTEHNGKTAPIKLLPVFSKCFHRERFSEKLRVEFKYEG